MLCLVQHNKLVLACRPFGKLTQVSKQYVLATE